MRIDKLENFTKGWFIGNFDPAILKTDQFEVGIQYHTVTDVVEPHYQRIATEYNLVIEGTLSVNGWIASAGDIFVYEPEVVCNVKFLSDCVIVVVKTPSIPDDKVVVDD